MIETNKLVRDLVCQNLADRGIAKRTKVRYVRGKEYETFLYAKLMEECAEVIGSNTKGQLTEELADLLEVIKAIRKHAGITEMELGETQTQKFCEKGGFFEGCIMEGIEYVNKD
jgi:predicted house-cleaning noncanonical NTP pyrophosphatase (MazG superfamily)|tara:strand:+ start:73 stop:414 length:342 start_codon:yes stop_codon:yes gene_type:complete